MAERANVVSNFKVVQGRLGTTPKAVRLTPGVFPVAGDWNAGEVWRSLDVLRAFIDSAMPRIVEEEGEPTWEDAEWQ